MKNICLSWVGGFDFTKFLEDKKDDGVFLALMKSDIAKTIDDFHILINTNSKHSNVRSKFLKYANRFCSKRQKIIVHEFSIKPSVLSDVHGSVMEVIREIESVTPATAIKWHFQLGGGAPQINAVWLMLVKVGYRAELIMTIHDKKSDSIKIEMRCPDKAISAEEFDDIIKKCDARLLDEWSNFPKYESIVHKSTVMKNLINNAFSIARHDVPILILGETGTGKELFAKAIHSSSGRTKLPMLTQNCAAIQESTANATLFGWSKGAWTGSVGEGRGLFQECHGGTLFLDEIADLSPEIQTRLLRALEYGEIQRVGDGRVCKVDVRVIAATNRDIRKLVVDGKFREDLYYRINVGMIKIPPLRERGSDACLIAENFLDEFNSRNQELIVKYNTKKFSRSAIKFIREYAWPGNVRELFHTIQRICVWFEGDVITDEEFKLFVTEPVSGPSASNFVLDNDHPVDLDEITRSIRKQYILKALKLSDNSKCGAARLLGYKNYQTLAHEMKRLNIDK